MKLSDQIRNAVASSSWSQYRIAKELGVAESTVSRFVNGKGGLSLDNIDRLAELLGLSLAIKPKTTNPEE